MGRKVKGKSPGNFPAKNPDVPIEDDPYWKVARNIFMDEHRVGRYIDRFYHFIERHPQWAEDFMEGIPTYYCVLGVPRGATREDFEQAFHNKMMNAYYPPEVIMAAFSAISTPSLRKEYDEFLFVAEQFSKGLPPFEKKELIEAHNENIEDAKNFYRMVEAQADYVEYWNLYMAGMPDLYEVAGLSKDADIEEIITECRQDTELSRKIYTLMTDPVFRKHYDIVLGMISSKMEPEELASRETKRENWKRIGPDMAGKIILTALTKPDFLDEYLSRHNEILNTNQDWKNYLPPSKETFFSILGLETGSLQGDKKEAETIIREKYRELERTPTVNLAYSVLKNQVLREDYLWVLENNTLIETLVMLLSIKKVRGPPKKGRVSPWS